MYTKQRYIFTYLFNKKKLKKRKSMAIFDFFSTAQNFALNHIDNKIGLYALIGIVVMFIIYLIRPKPLHKTIPSI